MPSSGSNGVTVGSICKDVVFVASVSHGRLRFFFCYASESKERQIHFWQFQIVIGTLLITGMDSNILRLVLIRCIKLQMMPSRYNLACRINRQINFALLIACAWHHNLQESGNYFSRSSISIRTDRVKLVMLTYLPSFAPERRTTKISVFGFKWRSRHKPLLRQTKFRIIQIKIHNSAEICGCTNFEGYRLVCCAAS